MPFPTGFSPIESVPGKTEWGLDTLRRSFKTGYAADAAILDTVSPLKYTSDLANGGIHSQMFLTDKTVSEASASASRLDLIYTGLLNGSVLPPGQHKVNSIIQTSQSQISTIPVWMTVAAPQNEFTWISSSEGAGAPVTNTVGVGSLNGYRIPGTVTVQNSGAQLQNLAGFGGLVKVKDIIYVRFDIVYPGPFTLGQVAAYVNSSFPYLVTSIVSNTQVNVTPFVNISYQGKITYFANQTFGLHPSSITVVSIRWGCGLTSLFATLDPNLWGQLLAQTAFTQISSVITESLEIVPGQFWKNTQKSTVQVLPLSC